MARRRALWLLLPRQIRAMPADLTAVVIGVLVVNLVVFAPVVRETPLRVPFGLAFVLFLPGYALIAALFPEAGESPADAADEDADGWFTGDDRGIDGIERVALSFGLSIAVVPLIGLALNFTPWGIRLVPIMLATSGFTLGMVAIAAVRRWALPAEDRFRVPYRAWIDRGRREVFEPADRVDAALNVALALSILLAVGTLGFAVMVPSEGERYTQFYILGEDDDGELVAANYPEELVVGGTAEVILGVDNQEHDEVTYTVVVQLQEVDFERDAAGNVTNVTVQAVDEVMRFEVTLAHNETVHERLTVGTDDPAFAGEDRRLQFLLYADTDRDTPDEPSDETAYRDLHLWVDVRE